MHACMYCCASSVVQVAASTQPAARLSRPRSITWGQMLRTLRDPHLRYKTPDSRLCSRQLTTVARSGSRRAHNRASTCAVTAAAARCGRRPNAAAVLAAAASGAATTYTFRYAWADAAAASERTKYTLVWTPEQIRTVLEKYLENRQLENIVASLGIFGAVLADMAMLTGTGLVGVAVGLGSVVGYVATHMEYVNDDAAFGRLRFMDVSPTHEALMGLLEYHRVKRVGQRIATAAHMTTLALANEAATVALESGKATQSRGGGEVAGDEVASQLLTAPNLWEFNVIDSDEVRRHTAARLRRHFCLHPHALLAESLGFPCLAGGSLHASSAMRKGKDQNGVQIRSDKRLPCCEVVGSQCAQDGDAAVSAECLSAPVPPRRSSSSRPPLV
eukprot:COSAG05_NODE_2009_length_3706_cov_2.105905_2_plen_388_part_00